MSFDFNIILFIIKLIIFFYYINIKTNSNNILYMSFDFNIILFIIKLIIFFYYINIKTNSNNILISSLINKVINLN